MGIYLGCAILASAIIAAFVDPLTRFLKPSRQIIQLIADFKQIWREDRQWDRAIGITAAFGHRQAPQGQTTGAFGPANYFQWSGTGLHRRRLYSGELVSLFKKI